ncbi:PREDICTED: DNA repair protein REV1 [Polistes canadensis]|uniref:DNA repair protein REV1 n=1 Tax=Polistes canadensis TaxID=91411 RepID=UPI000718FEF6|nr:PREDICTED: DNA repair protein REV1 [Polistes canadensis]
MAVRRKNRNWNDNGFEDWGGYMEAKKTKLEEQFHEEAQKEYKDPSNLFKGISIFVNGYTDPTADELRQLMMEHGGTYHHYMRPTITTHIIASNLPYSKIVLHRKAQCPMPICKPEWIIDSIKAGKVLNYENYLLLTNCTGSQPQLNFKVNTHNKKDNVNNTINDNNNMMQSIVEPSAVVNVAASTSKDFNQDINNSLSTNLKKTKGTALSSKNSEFISEFYNNSRLHHIATMGATFKDYINELRDKSDGKFLGLERLKKMKESNQNSQHSNNSYLTEDEMLTSQERQNTIVKNGPVIMHIDMDCFFVSVGLRNRPNLRGLPVAVAHAKGNKSINTESSNVNEQDEEEYGSFSEIASCSYEARKAGVKNGMFLGAALKICPELHTIKYDFEDYKEVSYSLYNIVASYTLDIEAVSCDEMYVNCTKILEESHLMPMEFATIIRNEIRQTTNCPVSAGFGSNKLRARLATKKAKPDGQFYIEDNNVFSYIDPLSVQDLPGVGYTTAKKLHKININTCVELRSLSLRTLQKDFGKKMGELLYDMCRGIDKTKLNLEHVRKSVSAEVNYGIRFEDNGEAVDFLKKLCIEVHSRLKKINAKGRCITLKLMVRAKEAPVETMKFMGHGICDCITKSKNLMAPIDDLTIITKEVIGIWNQLHLIPQDMRGIGIQISRLEIQKNKFNDNNLMNFVNKTKQPQMVNINSNQCRDSENNDLNTCSVNKEAVASSKTTISNNNDIFSKPSNSRSESIEGRVDIIETLPNNHDKRDSSNTPMKNNISSPFNRSIILLPSQDINESVLIELPEEIRSEILEAKLKKQNSFNSKSKSQVQINQENNVNTEINNLKVNKKEGENSKVQKTLDNNLQSSEISIKVSNRNIEKNDVPHTSSQSLSDTSENYMLSQQIDESTLNELPDNIRLEIITTMFKKNDKNKSVKNTQTRQEQFFKQTKPNSGKIMKNELPPIQELDMSVLLELPEDIRNDIFNEYKSNKQQNNNSSTSGANISNEQMNHQKHTEVSAKQSPAIENVSFSQVDPDFLAALPIDMQHDVQEYCIAKKKEKQVKNTNNLSNNNTAIDNSNNQWNVLQYPKNTKLFSKLKNNGKYSKVVSSKNNRKKNIKLKKSTAKERSNTHEAETARKSDNINSNNLDNRDDNMVTPSSTALNNSNNKEESVDEIEIIFAYIRSITKNDKITNKYRKTLTNIISKLFILPIEKIKMQIQTWIARSKSVNEVDFLSVATFLSMLPEKKRVEDLHILLKTMHRCTTKTGSCIWHRIYGKTVVHVQRYMQIEYNSNLMVPPIRCDCFKYNKNDVI